MSKLYPPLAILQALTYRQDETERLQTTIKNHPDFRPLIHTFGPKTLDAKTTQTLNLDDFMNWVIGSTFCKTTYDGSYAFLNTRLLDLHRSSRNKKSYKQNRIEFRQTLAFATMFECWSQYKQVYRFDADFVEELLQTDTLHIPTEVLYRLPFRCFYLDLEDIPRFQPYIGVFVYVGFDEQNQIPNLAIFRITEKREQTPDGEYPIYPSFCSGNDMQKWQLLRTTETGTHELVFTKTPNQHMKGSNLDDGDVFELLFFLLQSMLYLTSNKPDVTQSPKRQYVNLGKKKDTTLKGHDLVLTDVGIRYGMAIRKAKQQESETTIVIGKTTKTRKPMVSHVRKAHWHTYWKGKGRTTRVLRWIPPTFISSHGKELPITIHNVKL